MKTVKMHVSGLVQGVAFRYMSKLKADELHIHGYAKNLEDGSVEVLAQGPKAQVKQFMQIIAACPSPAGRVDHFHYEEISTTEKLQRFLVL